MKLGDDRARHLLMRTGFSPKPREIKAFAALTPAQAVDRLLAGVRTSASIPPPAWLDAAARPPDRKAMRAMAPADRRMARKKTMKQARAQGMALKAWWYTELITTPSPLTERLVLFWHNHFTSSLKKVRFPSLLYQQNVTLRQHAAGSFRALLMAMARDPAMIVYLDGRTNRKRKPNENFARELLELFTLGEGHYTERDIKEAARAFTGWSVDPRTGEFVFRARQHDDGEKMFLGERGAFGGEDIIKIVLKQPRVAEHIVEKLWRELCSMTPEPAEVKRLAAIFRGADYAMRPLLKALLTSPRFYDPAHRHALIKSPAHLIAGTVRWFDVRLDDPVELVRAGQRLGQDLFDPPNVKGWPGGARWITSDTLLKRQQLLARVLRDPGTIPALAAGGLRAFLGPLGPGEADVRGHVQRTVLGQAPVYAMPAGLGDLDALRHLVRDPTYQLT